MPQVQKKDSRITVKMPLLKSYYSTWSKNRSKTTEMNKCLYKKTPLCKNSFHGTSMARPLTKVHVLILMNSQFKSTNPSQIELGLNTNRFNQSSSLISLGGRNTCMSTITCLLVIRLQSWWNRGYICLSPRGGCRRCKILWIGLDHGYKMSRGETKSISH